MSSGEIVRKSISSQAIPNSFSALIIAFSNDTNCKPNPIIVTSFPCFTISAFPNGIVNSSSGTSHDEVLYKAFGSRNITGLGSRILANSRPFACTGPLGITTFNPGV